MSVSVPLRCPGCGLVHWSAAPKLREAFDAMTAAGRITPSDLAEKIGGSANGANNLLARLVREGLAVREPGAVTGKPGLPRVEYRPAILPTPLAS